VQDPRRRSIRSVGHNCQYTGSVPSASAASSAHDDGQIRSGRLIPWIIALLCCQQLVLTLYTHRSNESACECNEVLLKHLPLVDATAEMQPAQTALSHAAETPSASATELRRTIETKNATIRALHEDINQLKQQIVDLHDVSHANKSDARDAGFIAGKTEAYRDCEARTREVAASVWYVNERPSREALLHLASGFQRLSSDPDLS